MPAVLDVRETPDGLRIRVHKPANRALTALVLIGGAVFSFFIFHSTDGPYQYRAAIGAICILATALQLWRINRGTNVVLEVNKLDLISTGHAPGRFEPTSIARADIYQLSFKEGFTREDFGTDGLYAEHHGILRNAETCILPGIDAHQAEEVIAAIMSRFPDTGTLKDSKESKRPRSSSLTSLDLSNRVPHSSRKR